MGCKSFSAVAESPLFAAAKPALSVLASFALLTPSFEGCLRVALGYLVSCLVCFSDFRFCSPHLCCNIWMSLHCVPCSCALAVVGTMANARREHMPQTTQRDSSFIRTPLTESRCANGEGESSAGRAQSSSTRTATRSCTASVFSNIQIANPQCVGLDELATGLDHVAHQGRKNLVGLQRIFDTHLQQPPRVGVDRGFPQLFRVHLAKALEALDLASLLGFLEQPRTCVGKTAGRLGGVSAANLRAVRAAAVQRPRHFQQRPKIGAGKETAR